MKQFNSLAIGLLAAIAIAPMAGAYESTNNAPQSEQPAENLHAQVNVNIGIGLGSQPRPQPRVIVVETEPRPQQNVIVVETSQRSGSESYRSRQRWYSKHGYWRGRGHSKHDEDRDDD